MTSACAGHPERPGVVVCHGCARPLCGECFRFHVDEHPSCAACAYEASTRQARWLALGVAFLGMDVAAALYVATRFDAVGVGVAILSSGIVGLVLGLVLGWRALFGPAPRVLPRPPDQPLETHEEAPTPGAPYRSVARRVVMAVSPRLSARSTALVLLGALVLSALLVPRALHRPAWIEAELVLAAWWTLVGGTLTVLLFRGFRLDDDHAFRFAWERRFDEGAGSGPTGPGPATTDAPAVGQALQSMTGCADSGEGCAGVVFGVVAIGLGLALAWLVVELVVPVTFLLAYALFMRAIGRVANDRHGCRGSLVRSLVRGLSWATVYVGPLALLVWLAHRL